MDSSSPTPSADTAPDGGENGRRRASELVRDFAAHSHGETIMLGDLLDHLGDRAFGMLFLVLTLPNVIPLPGLSTATGIPLALLGLQLAAGAPHPWLPRRLASVRIGRDALLGVLARAHGPIERIERHLAPRLAWLTEGTGERAVGVAVAILAAVLSLPIVFGNLPPALAIAALALGLIEKDGALVAAGLAGGVLAIALVTAVVFGLGETALFVIRGLANGGW